MKPIVIIKDDDSISFLYEQLYTDIKKQIMEGDMVEGERCPSIRGLAADLEISVTTVMQAYNQLLAEGYIKNRPGSGYFVERIRTGDVITVADKASDFIPGEFSHIDTEYMYDEEAFDFIRWKKCAAKIYTEYSESLLFGSDLKGEYALRMEISKYLFHSRGVKANPENIIIAAGTQQSIFHLGRILKAKGIGLIGLEKPGYTPVKSMFEDAGFSTSSVPVSELGIEISMLPANIVSAVYVNPSNQFPTGVVMPAGRRYEILEWAANNDSYIIEDDYNSELRYFGKPLPTIKSLDTRDRVIYLGSFSSTLFSAIKISYMVLPAELTGVFEKIKKNYSQTCSKAEQLTLAYYMSEGYYYTAIRKKRALYTKKLKATVDAFEKHKYEGIELINTNSGLFVTIRISTDKDADKYIEIAKDLRLYTSILDEISTKNEHYISIYYSFVPFNLIDDILKNLITRWRNV